MTAPKRSSLVPWLCVLSICALGVCLWCAPDALPRVQLCWFSRLTGIPCPGCGITRSVCCIVHGRFADAWALNPFGYLIFAALVVCAAGPVIAHRRPGFEARVLCSRAGRWLPITLVISMTLFGLWRALFGWPP